MHFLPVIVRVRRLPTNDEFPGCSRGSVIQNDFHVDDVDRSIELLALNRDDDAECERVGDLLRGLHELRDDDRAGSGK